MVRSFPTSQMSRLMSPQGMSISTERQRPIRVRFSNVRDTDLLMQMYRQLSDRSIWLRFGRPRLDLPDEQLRNEVGRLFGQNTLQSTTLIGTTGEGAGANIVAVVQLVQSAAEPGLAELAIVVRDDYQREGVGRELVRMIHTIARARGVCRLRAHTQAENHAVMRLIRGMGLPYTAETRYGETTVLIDVA